MADGARTAEAAAGHGARADAEHIAEALAAASARTQRLLAPLDAEQLARQHSPLMSPLCWDVAHMAQYEELWLVRALDPQARGDARLDDLYDAFAHPRATRAELDLLGPEEAVRYASAVRARTLEILDHLDPDALGPDAPEPLLRDGFVYGMVLQHAHQHVETILATLSLMDDLPAELVDHARAHTTSAPTTGAADHGEVPIDGGCAPMGTDAEAWAYDNERPAHDVDLAPFLLDAHPVTNAAYAELVEAGVYDDERWWSPAGWAWRREANVAHPLHWRRDGDGWWRRRFGVLEPVPPDEAVQHVCWHEAEAYARWRGKRLPTEAEWERAATAGRARRFPWGDDAPTDAHAALATVPERFGPGPVAARPAGAGGGGALDLLGGVWEWTASELAPYPGFRAFPYPEYSEVFFGDGLPVLRGGSWATHPFAARATFRNWDLPIRRQIFAGFRCARDVDAT